MMKRTKTGGRRRWHLSLAVPVAALGLVATATTATADGTNGSSVTGAATYKYESVGLSAPPNTCGRFDRMHYEARFPATTITVVRAGVAKTYVGPVTVRLQNNESLTDKWEANPDRIWAHHANHTAPDHHCNPNEASSYVNVTGDGPQALAGSNPATGGSVSCFGFGGDDSKMERVGPTITFTLRGGGKCRITDAAGSVQAAANIDITSNQGRCVRAQTTGGVPVLPAPPTDCVSDDNQLIS